MYVKNCINFSLPYLVRLWTLRANQNPLKRRPDRGGVVKDDGRISSIQYQRVRDLKITYQQREGNSFLSESTCLLQLGKSVSSPTPPPPGRGMARNGRSQRSDGAGVTSLITRGCGYLRTPREKWAQLVLSPIPIVPAIAKVRETPPPPLPPPPRLVRPAKPRPSLAIKWAESREKTSRNRWEGKSCNRVKPESRYILMWRNLIPELRARKRRWRLERRGRRQNSRTTKIIIPPRPSPFPFCETKFRYLPRTRNQPVLKYKSPSPIAPPGKPKRHCSLPPTQVTRRVQDLKCQRSLVQVSLKVEK